MTLWGPTHILMVGGASLATHGKWKAMIRVENGRAVDAVSLYLPNDPAIALGIGLRRLQRTAGERYPDDGLAARAREGAEGDARRPALGVQA